MNAMALSVVIPAYNARDTLGAQIEAVLRQDVDIEFELVVVDNGSTDGTAELVQTYATTDHRVRLVSATSGRGPSHARNIGISAALAERVACCDADDIVGIGWLSAMNEGLAEHAAVAGVLDVEQLNNPTVIAARGATVAGSAGNFAGITFAHGCNLGIRRSTFNSVGGFNEDLRAGEEIDLAIRLAAQGVSVVELRDAIVHYRYRADPKSQWNQAFEGGRVKPYLCRLLRSQARIAPPRLSGLRNWVWLVRTIPRLRNDALRLRWQWVLASRCGQLAGCVQYRTVFI